MKSVRTLLFGLALLVGAVTGLSAEAQDQQAAPSKKFGDAVAAYSLQNYEKAVRLWLELAEAGDRESQYRLGLMYQDGRGVAFDMAEAARWQTMAGKAGHGRAQYLLGNMYATGLGVKEDPYEAFRWYLLAAENGQARAQFHVATQYLVGDVAEKNYLSAHIWFARAVEGFGEGIDKELAIEARDKTFAALNEDDRAKAAAELK